MTDYISREAIINELEEEIEAGNIALDEDVWTNRGLKIALKDVKAAEAADVQPVRRGRWEYYKNIGIMNIYICTNCKNKVEMAIDVEPSSFCYCPKCAADMQGDENG